MSRRFGLTWMGGPLHHDFEAVDGRYPHRRRWAFGMTSRITLLLASLCIANAAAQAQSLESVSLPSSATDRDLERLRGASNTDLRIIVGKHITTISALQGLPLTNLILQCTQVTDLKPLTGMRLLRLSLCSSRHVSDITPLRGMPLETLSLRNTGVSDLSPISDCPLKAIGIEQTDVRDLAALRDCPLEAISFEVASITNGIEGLRGINTLRLINCMPANEFWSRYDSGEFSKEAQPQRRLEPSSAGAPEGRSR